MNKYQLQEHSEYKQLIENSNNIEDIFLVDIILECGDSYIDYLLPNIDREIPINNEGIINFIKIPLITKKFKDHLEVIKYIKDVGRTDYFFLYSYLDGVLQYKTLDIYQNVNGLEIHVKHKLRDKKLDSLLE